MLDVNVPVTENLRFCVTEFVTVSDDRISRSKMFPLSNADSGTFRSKIWKNRKFENSWDFVNWVLIKFSHPIKISLTPICAFIMTAI